MLTQKELAEAIEKGRDALESKGGRISLQMKAATDTIVSPNPGGYVLDPNTPAPSGDSVLLRTLIPNIPVSGSGAVTYFRFSQQGNVREVAENAQKPQFSAGITGQTLPLCQVAGIEKISEEALDDVPQLMRTAEQFAKAGKDRIALGRVLSGVPGPYGDISGILNDASIGVTSSSTRTVPIFTAIMTSIGLIEQRGFSPNAIVTTPTTLQTLIGRVKMSYEKTFSTAASNPDPTDPTEIGNAFGFGGVISYAPAFGAVRLHIAGLPVITVTTAPGGDQKQFLIGDFARGSALYTTGEKLEIGRDADDFSRDRYTLRVSERLNVAVKVPSAFQFVDTNVV